MLTIDEFAAVLAAIPEEGFTHHGVLDYLRGHRVNPATLHPYLYFCSEKYTRNLILRTPLFELIAICWDVGQVSSIHKSSRAELLDGDRLRQGAGAEFPAGAPRSGANGVRTGTHHAVPDRRGDAGRGGPGGADPPGGESDFVRLAGGDAAHLFASIRYLRGVRPEGQTVRRREAEQRE